MILLFKLLLAHLLADFLLQPDSWVADKERHLHKSPKLYLHIALHFVCMSLIVWDTEYLPLILSITILHGIIDYLKLRYQKKKRVAFFADQTAHILVIVLGVILFENTGGLTFEWKDNYMIILTGLVWITLPSSVVIKNIISLWDAQIQIRSTALETKSLLNAGKMIGILERLLVFIFILVNHWEAVGFLITAKSVFRFSDLKQAQDRKLTEYILIGTLLSFGIAIVTALCVQFFINQL